jgi:ABC-type molybdate transport system substrate-binding protein
VISGNARAGLLADSILSRADLPADSCRWPVPLNAYPPVSQAMVILNRAATNPVAATFLHFMRSQTAREIITEHGYLTEQGLD